MIKSKPTQRKVKVSIMKKDTNKEKLTKAGKFGKAKDIVKVIEARSKDLYNVEAAVTIGRAISGSSRVLKGLATEAEVLRGVTSSAKGALIFEGVSLASKVAIEILKSAEKKANDKEKEEKEDDGFLDFDDPEFDEFDDSEPETELESDPVDPEPAPAV